MVHLCNRWDPYIISTQKLYLFNRAFLVACSFIKYFHVSQWFHQSLLRVMPCCYRTLSHIIPGFRHCHTSFQDSTKHCHTSFRNSTKHCHTSFHDSTNIVTHHSTILPNCTKDYIRHHSTHCHTSFYNSTKHCHTSFQDFTKHCHTSFQDSWNIVIRHSRILPNLVPYNSRSPPENVARHSTILHYSTKRQTSFDTWIHQTLYQIIQKFTRTAARHCHTSSDYSNKHFHTSFYDSLNSFTCHFFIIIPNTVGRHSLKCRLPFGQHCTRMINTERKHQIFYTLNHNSMCQTTP